MKEKRLHYVTKVDMEYLVVDVFIDEILVVRYCESAKIAMILKRAAFRRGIMFSYDRNTHPDLFSLTRFEIFIIHDSPMF